MLAKPRFAQAFDFFHISLLKSAVRKKFQNSWRRELRRNVTPTDDILGRLIDASNRSNPSLPTA
jgi:hypothetical protein